MNAQRANVRLIPGPCSAYNSPPRLSLNAPQVPLSTRFLSSLAPAPLLISPSDRPPARPPTSHPVPQASSFFLLLSFFPHVLPSFFLLPPEPRRRRCRLSRLFPSQVSVQHSTLIESWYPGRQRMACCAVCHSGWTLSRPLISQACWGAMTARRAQNVQCYFGRRRAHSRILRSSSP